MSMTFEQYGISFKVTATNKRIEKFTKYIDYLNSLYRGNERLMDVVIHNDLKYVVPSEYYVIEEKINEINNIISNLENNKEYAELFGVLYHAHKTDIIEIIDSIDMYDKYKDVFVSEKKVYNSFAINSSLLTITTQI